jgi:hypothetical protein
MEERKKGTLNLQSMDSTTEEETDESIAKYIQSPHDTGNQQTVRYYHEFPERERKKERSRPSSHSFQKRELHSLHNMQGRVRIHSEQETENRIKNVSLLNRRENSTKQSQTPDTQRLLRDVDNGLHTNRHAIPNTNANTLENEIEVLETLVTSVSDDEDLNNEKEQHTLKQDLENKNSHLKSNLTQMKILLNQYMTKLETLENTVKIKDQMIDDYRQSQNQLKQQNSELQNQGILQHSPQFLRSLNHDNHKLLQKINDQQHKINFQNLSLNQKDEQLHQYK